jgi:hypothetical protein
MREGMRGEGERPVGGKEGDPLRLTLFGTSPGGPGEEKEDMQETLSPAWHPEGREKKEAFGAVVKNPQGFLTTNAWFGVF